jgi:hypothetical protein
MSPPTVVVISGEVEQPSSPTGVASVVCKCHDGGRSRASPIIDVHRPERLGSSSMSWVEVTMMIPD